MPNLPQSGQQNVGFIALSGAISLAEGASVTLTIQQPPGVKVLAQLGVATVQMGLGTTTFTVSQAQNGTDATLAGSTAAVVPVALNPVQPNYSASRLLAFIGSNVGAGTKIANPFLVTGGPLLIDLTQMQLPQIGPNINFSITITNTSSVTDNAYIQIPWVEL